MRKIPAPVVKAVPKEPPKERKPLVIETKGFDTIADAMVKATKAQGDATAKLQDAIAAVLKGTESRAFEVEIKRDSATGMMNKLIVSPIRAKR